MYGLMVLIALFALEAETFVDSWRFGRVSFELYAGSLHGFMLGWLCFLSGFIFIFTGNGFWNIVKKELPKDNQKMIDEENNRDIISIFFAVPWQGPEF